MLAATHPHQFLVQASRHMLIILPAQIDELQPTSSTWFEASRSDGAGRASMTR